MPYLNGSNPYLFNDDLLKRYIKSNYWCTRSDIISLGTRWINLGIPSGLSSYMPDNGDVYVAKPVKDAMKELSDKIKEVTAKSGYLNLEDLRKAVKEVFGCELKLFRAYNTEDYMSRFLTQAYIDFFRHIQGKNITAEQRQKLAESYLTTYDSAITGLLKDMDFDNLQAFLKAKYEDIIKFEREHLSDFDENGKTTSKDFTKNLYSQFNARFPEAQRKTIAEAELAEIRKHQMLMSGIEAEKELEKVK